MSDFHDPELRQHLGRLSGPYPDDNEAFAAWQRRVGQARRRRAMAVTSGAAMSLIVAVVAIAALQGPRGQTFRPADTSESTDSTSEVDTTEPSTTDSSLPSTTASTTVAPETVPATELAAETLEPVGDTTSVSGEQPPAATTNKAGSTHPIQPKPATSPPQEPTKTIVSDGGSITVRVHDGKLKLDGIDENDGYEAREGESGKDKVKVTFSSEDHRWEITAWLVDGVIYDSVVDKGNDQSGESFGSGGGAGGDHRDGDHVDGD